MDVANLLWGVVFSAIGAGYLLYARRQGAPVPGACGLALVLYPYFVSNTWWLFGIGVVLSAIPWFVRL